MRLVIHGGGRMAKQLATAIPSAGHELQALVSRNRPAWLSDTEYYPSFEGLSELPDVVIDFTLGGGTALAAHWCRSNLVALVSGTTALKDDDRQAIQGASDLVPVLWAPNLAKGPNLLLQHVHETARALGKQAAVRVLDVHHSAKKDMPSGTALLLARAVASAWQVPIDDVLELTTDDQAKTQTGRVSCVSRREGDVVGEHQVTFYTNEDTIVLGHSAKDRSIYAHGSIEAAAWLSKQPAGLYSGADWLAT